MEKIYISSLPFRSDEKYIEGLFAPFGAVRQIDLYADWVNPTFEPYAIVDIETRDVVGLVDALDGRKIGRTYIRVHKKTA